MIASHAAAASSMDRRRADEFRQWLLGATVLAAGAELLILRLFTRTAIHIPGFSELRAIYVPISEAGRSAYYLAVVLLTVALVSLVEDLRRRTAVTARLGAAGIGLFLIVAVIARIGVVDALTLDGATLASLLLLTPWALGGRRGGSRFTLVLLVAAFAIAGLVAIEEGLGVSGWMLGREPWLAFCGEVLAVGAAALTPLLLGSTRNRHALIWGMVVGAATFTALLLNPSTVKILMLWNFGLAGYLPSALYGLGAGAATYTMVALFATGRRASALGMTLLFMGGVGLHSTYQTGLVLAGFALLGVAESFDHPTSSGSRLDSV